MPRSRNTRSNSPLKSLKTTTGQSEYDRIFQNVQEMFSDTVDADVIYFVLSECHWRSKYNHFLVDKTCPLYAITCFKKICKAMWDLGSK